MSTAASDHHLNLSPSIIEGLSPETVKLVLNRLEGEAKKRINDGFNK